jgi:hypothetical protein
MHDKSGRIPDEPRETLKRDVQIKDSRIARELETNGYVVVPALEAAAVAGFYSTVYKEISNACNGRLNYNTGSDLEGPVRYRTFEKIRQAFTSVLDGYFGNFDIVAGLMFVKRPSAHFKGRVDLHCDPTLLPDENRQRHINIWSPLVDVDETNGALWVVPRSHRLFAPVHAITIPPPYAKIADTVMRYGRCIRMKAGEALIFDNRTVHYSLQNFSTIDRPSLVASFVPAGADLISLFKSGEPGSRIEVYRQPHSWYQGTGWTRAMERPGTGTFIGYLGYEPGFLDEQEFVELVKSGKPGTDYEFELDTQVQASLRASPHHRQ